MKIARVFPHKNSFLPQDHDAYFDTPGFFTPHYDEAHISVTFTWDVLRGKYLAECWKPFADVVKIGGPAFGDPGKDFTPGMYVRPGVVFTSRGCPNACPFCFVPKREGKIRELPIVPGNIIQDNNLLACSEGHIKEVFNMLKTQLVFPRMDPFSEYLEQAREVPDKIQVNSQGGGMNKYRNIKVNFNGFDFDSKAECLFYQHLLSLQQKGQIIAIECQPVIKFPDGTKMIPDFKAVWTITELDGKKSTPEIAYYDVKSPATRLNKTYRLKKRLLHYFFKDIKFVEVLRDRKGWKFL